MTKFYDLPEELISEIFAHLITNMPITHKLKTLSTLRLVSHRFNEAMNTQRFWKPYIPKAAFPQDTVSDIAYPQYLLQYAIKLEKFFGNSEFAVVFLKVLALRDFAEAYLILNHRTFRQCFLENTHFRHVTEIANQYEAIGFFILQDPAFRKMLLEQENKVKCIQDLTHLYPSIAEFVTQDKELYQLSLTN